MKTSKIMFGALCALLVGCGGSAGIGSGFPDPPVDTALRPTGPGVDGGSTLRAYKAGDTWEFTVGGNMLREDYDDQQKLKSKTSGPVTGTMIRQVSAVTFQGQPALKFTDTLSYQINGGINTVEILETYARQEVDGSVTMLGRRDNNVDCGVVTKTWLPATFAAGTNVGGQAKFTGLNGFTSDFYNTSTAFTATNASSVVSTTASPFITWRTVYSDSYDHEWNVPSHAGAGEFIGQGYRIKTVEAISAIDDWSPLLGAPVSRAYQTTRTDSIADTVTHDPVNDTYLVTYHIEKRSLNLKMVLAARSLQ